MMGLGSGNVVYCDFKRAISVIFNIFLTCVKCKLMCNKLMQTLRMRSTWMGPWANNGPISNKTKTKTKLENDKYSLLVGGCLIS